MPTDGSAAPTKLSPPGQRVNFLQFAISPDSQKVVFMDADDGRVYSVPTDGSAAPVYTGLYFTGISGWDTDPYFFVGPDSEWVVYWDESYRVFSARIDGSGSRILLSGAATYVLYDLSVSPDGEWVYFASNLPVTRGALCRVAIDGSGAPVELSGGVDSTHADQFRLSPDGARVAYRSSVSGASTTQLYSAPSDGSEPPVLLDPTPGSSIFAFEFAPIGTRVVFIAQEAGLHQLYSVPGDGSSAPLRLNRALVAGGDVASFLIDPQGRRVVYLADQTTDEVFELYSVPLDRVQPQFRLGARPVAGGDVLPSHQGGYRISPDGQRVVYRADLDIDGVTELYSAPLDDARRFERRGLDARPSVKLNQPLVAGRAVTEFAIGADSRRVVYVADQEADGRLELFSAAIDGRGSPIKLNEPLPPGGTASYSFLSPTRVVFAAPLGASIIEDGYGLHSTSIDGSTSPIVLTPTFPLGPVAGDVQRFRVTPDGAWAVYLADQDEDYTDELYGVPTDGSAPPVKLNGPLPLGGDVGGGYAELQPGVFALTPDGTRVVYMADQDTLGTNELYAVPRDGSASPLRLHAPLSAGWNVHPEFQVAPDGSSVVYRTFHGSVAELWSTGLDGLVPERKLSGTLVPGGSVSSLAIDPGATRAVFLADRRVDERVELWVAPLDGSLPPLDLNAPLPVGGDVNAFAIDPLGARVVYRASWSASQDLLCSVPIDRSQEAVRLNDGDSALASAFLVSPDAAWVVYLSGGRVFSVPIEDGVPRNLSGPTLSPPPPSFAIDPDSRRVVYVADSETDGVWELWSAPLDGSAAPLKLNAPLVAGGDVGGDSFTAARDCFRITPDGTRVVYFADQETPGREELYVARIDGRGQPVKLSGTPGVGEVWSLMLDGAGRQVVWVTAAPVRVLRTSILGGLEPELLAEAAHVVPELAFTPDGGRLLHRADADTLDVFELYSTELPRLPRLRAGPEPARP